MVVDGCGRMDMRESGCRTPGGRDTLGREEDKGNGGFEMDDVFGRRGGSVK